MKKYMEPFLLEHGFLLKQSQAGAFLYQHREKTQLKITFAINSHSICVDLIRGKMAEFGFPLPLAFFLDDLEHIGERYRDISWYYDTEEDLVGALEEQADILLDKGFDWLFGRIDLDIFGIMEARGEERAAKFKASTPEEQDRIHHKILSLAKAWENRRIKPDKWK